MSDTTRPTFAGMPQGDLADLSAPSVVLFGASEATPYDPMEPSHSADAPAALRAASMQFARQLTQHDFDLGFPMLASTENWRGVVDAGDVPTRPADAAGNRTRIAAATRAVIEAGGVPVLLGGDDSVPIPFLAGFEDQGLVTVIQVDAHADWGDEIRGEKQGYGSPMRRVSEMPWVDDMVQIGLRGLGSGGGWQIDDATAWGSRLISSYELRATGMTATIDRIPAGRRYVVSIDLDALDPAIFSAVAMPTPGGLRYEDVVELLRGLSARGSIAGVIVAEYVPERDDNRRSAALVAARIVSVAIGCILGPAEAATRPPARG